MSAHASSKLSIYSGTSSFVGTGRERNEDAVYQGKVPLGYLAAVADGMGGHAHGDTAARVTLEALVAACEQATEDPVATLQAAFRDANGAVRKHAASRGEVMGATCVAAIVAQGRLHVAHAGDARLYLLRGANLYSLTRDHSIFQEIADIKGPLAATGFASSLKHVMSKSVGAEPRIEPTVRGPIPLVAGDALLLCSDGISGALDESRIQRIMAGGTAREAAQRLVEAVEQEGGEDNATAVVLRIDAEAGTEEARQLTFDTMLSMRVQTADGNSHPIVDVRINPSNWGVVALELDLSSVKAEARCEISIADVGPITSVGEPITTPQRTEALVDMAKAEGVRARPGFAGRGGNVPGCAEEPTPG